MDHAKQRTGTFFPNRLVLQALYGLTDEQAKFQIRDRLSFMRFLGLDRHGRVPDARTIWLFRETLTKAGAIDSLFARFDAPLCQAGYLAMGGQVFDASLEAPRQRNGVAEKQDLKAGRIPEDWAERPAKLRQKIGRPLDAEARPPQAPSRRTPLTLVIATPVYGYKSHVCADRRHRFIRKWSVTDAASYDGRELPGLLHTANTGSGVWADMAYRSAKNERRVEAAGLVSRVHFRKPPGRLMPEPRAGANAARSRERAGVEHVFADQKHRMGLLIRTIGLVRTKTKIGLAILAYNLRRYLFLETSAATG